MSSDLAVYVAPTFMRDYRKAGVTLQALAEGAVKDLLRLASSDPGGWKRRYDRVAGLTGAAPVLEIDLAGGPRLLAVANGDLTLWRMGDHGLIDQVVRSKPPFPTEREPLPSQFHPERRVRLFPEDADEGYIDYANERTADWSYWLDEQQFEAGSEIESAVTDAFLSGRRVVHGLFGGPGTGKTTILVWLLKALATVEPGGAALDVVLEAPTAVRNQIENSTGWDLAPFSLRARGEGDPSPDVILVDDPDSLFGVELLLEARERSSVVFGFDPLQMGESITDTELEEWLGRAGAVAHWFTSCYRQKAVVGRAAKHVADTVAASSPFLRDDKKELHHRERAELTRRANDTTFVNPSGRVQTVVGPTHEQWELYWREIYRLRRSGRLWDHWPPLLVVTDPEAVVPDRWFMRMDAVATHRTTTDRLIDVKGLEYQHVLLLLGDRLYQSLENGFEGSGRNAYNRYRLFRIPFSRAKDSLVTFVFPTRTD
jgi:hypothetical protein